MLNGSFEISDFGGLDIWEKVLNSLLPVLNNAQQAPDIIRKKVERNDLGLKTGEGFFNYNSDFSNKLVYDRNEKLIQFLKSRVRT